jgi:phosphatidylethanolamine-binding protein (PEBP) family uncharacterized protein
MKKLALILLTSILFPINGLPAEASSPKPISFQAEVWVDNWFALYINGKKVGEDSVPITTERSFNSEKIKFSASYPFTVGIYAKDFTENLSGLEYIGKANQQIGDAGIIFQIRDLATNQIVAVSDSTWKVTILNKAPLNPECVTSKSPLTDCKYENTSAPKLWSTSSFKDSSWKSASIFTKEEVGVKDGYFDFIWDNSANLIWSSDLKLDNALLIRKVIKSASPTVLSTTKFQLTSPDLGTGNSLPKSATCDGIGQSPNLNWSGVPSGTKSLALIMNTVPGPARPGETAALSHAYLVIYNIPISASQIPAGGKSVGTIGQNFQGKSLGYTPPCSQGPGRKKYTFTLYALNSELNLAASAATEESITAAMQGKIIAKSVLDSVYERS